MMVSAWLRFYNAQPTERLPPQCPPPPRVRPPLLRPPKEVQCNTHPLPRVPQVGQHIQQLCHSIALLRCTAEDEVLDSTSRTLLLRQAHAVLMQMQVAPPPCCSV